MASGAGFCAQLAASSVSLVGFLLPAPRIVNPGAQTHPNKPSWHLPSLCGANPQLLSPLRAIPEQKPGETTIPAPSPPPGLSQLPLQGIFLLLHPVQPLGWSFPLISLAVLLKQQHPGIKPQFPPSLPPPYLPQKLALLSHSRPRHSSRSRRRCWVPPLQPFAYISLRVFLI